MARLSVYELLRRLQWTLYPPVCLVCGGTGGGRRDLCGGCRRDLPVNAPACPRCAAPVPVPRTCGRCLRRAPAFDTAWAAFRYEAPVSRLVQALKFRGSLAAGRLLGELMAEQLPPSSGVRPDVLVPVPLHPSRQRSRGYNQALELARAIARRSGIPLEPDLCERRRATREQVALSATERRANMRRAFRVTRTPPPSVAIIDDALATGSTTGELATALRRAGVEHVVVWCAARSTRPARS